MSKVTLESVAAEFRSGNSVPVERATLTRERMQEALEAYADARVREAQQWQLIETAPKDGTQIILWGPCCDIVTCFWAAYDSPPYWCIGSIEVDGDGFAALRGDPTHWMPLPAPPIPGPASHNPIGHMTISTTRRKP